MKKRIVISIWVTAAVMVFGTSFFLTSQKEGGPKYHDCGGNPNGYYDSLFHSKSPGFGHLLII